jgi:hypothetical protein
MSLPKSITDLSEVLKSYTNESGDVDIPTYLAAIKNNDLNFEACASYLAQDNSASRLKEIQAVLAGLPPLPIFQNSVQTKTKEKPLYDFYPQWSLQIPRLHRKMDWETLCTLPSKSQYRPTNMCDLSLYWKEGSVWYDWSSFSSFVTSLCLQEWWTPKAYRTFRFHLNAFLGLTSDNHQDTFRPLRFPKIDDLRLVLSAQNQTSQPLLVISDAKTVVVESSDPVPLNLATPNLHVLRIHDLRYMKEVRPLTASSFFSVIVSFNEKAGRKEQLRSLQRWLIANRSFIEEREHFSLLCDPVDFNDILRSVGSRFHEHIRTLTMDFSSPLPSASAPSSLS